MLVVTNPILLWVFKHGWEDPGCGRDDASQISILSALHALADQISDKELRSQVKKLSSKGLAKVANRMAGAR
jgi:glutaredoxin-related protein